MIDGTTREDWPLKLCAMEEAMDRSGEQLPGTPVVGRLQLPLARSWKTAQILMQWLGNWSSKWWWSNHIVLYMNSMPHVAPESVMQICDTVYGDDNQIALVITLSHTHHIRYLVTSVTSLPVVVKAHDVFCGLSLFYRVSYGSRMITPG